MVPLVVKNLTQRVDLAGVVTGAIAIGAVTFELQAYRLLRRWASGPLLIAAFALGLLATAGFSVTHDLWLFLVLGAIFGSGFGIAVACTTAVVGDLTAPASRGRAYGLYGMVATIPTVIAPTGALVALSAWGAPAVFRLVAVSCLLGIVASAALRRLPPHSEATTPIVTVLGNPRVIIALVVYTMLSATYGAVVSFTAFVVHGTALTSPAFFFFVMGLSRVFSRLVAGSLLDRFGEHLVAVPGLIIAAVGLACITLEGPWVAIAGLLYGAGFGTLQTSTIYAMLRQSPDDATAIVSGWWNFAVDFGVGLGALALAPVAAGVGYETTFRLLPVALAVPFALRLAEAALFGRRADLANTASNS